MTNEDYQRLGLSGEFADQHTMLLGGELIRRPFPSPPHDIAVSLTDMALKTAFGSGYWVRIHSALPIGDEDDPTPDLAVIAGSPRDFPTTTPRTAVLVVEVSDWTFGMDSGEKAYLYASAGVPEYWVLDVSDRQMMAFRDPVADHRCWHGYRYATSFTLTPDDTVSPTAAPTAVIRVADLLP